MGPFSASLERGTGTPRASECSSAGADPSDAGLSGCWFFLPADLGTFPSARLGGPLPLLLPLPAKAVLVRQGYRQAGAEREAPQGSLKRSQSPIRRADGVGGPCATVWVPGAFAQRRLCHLRHC